MRRTIHRLVAPVLGISLLAAVVNAAPAGAAGGLGFDDVPESSYYSDAASWLYASGITVGVQPGCFGPLDLVSRGDAATFMFRLDRHRGNQPTGGSDPFVDVFRPYQREPVAWLWASGLTTGTAPRRFEADRIVSRGEFATLLWRYAGTPTVAQPHHFADTTHSYQERALSWMASAGITSASLLFQPDAPLDRAQAATFLHRYSGSPSYTPPDLPTCERSIVEVLVSGGLTQQEAACATPFLSGFTIREITDTAQHVFPSMAMFTALMRIVDAGCVSNDRVTELIGVPR